MPPLPLLCLPRLVLCEVFRSLSIGEKIKLSHCSKKTSTQIYSSRVYSQKVLIGPDYLNVQSENNKDTFEISIYPNSRIKHNSNNQQFSIAYCSVIVMSTENGIRTYWKNYREGFKYVIRHLSKMFHCKILSNVSYFNKDLYELTLSELFDQQVEFKALTIPLNMLFEQISSKFGLVEYLKILSDTTNPGFTPVFSSSPQNISIKSSYWFTLESFLACTCQRIILVMSHLGNKDLDVVLRKWKAGGFPNLKYLKIHSLSFTDNGEHILGMNLWDLDGMVIQTDDGSKKATIKLGGCIKMSVTPL